jgi:hypothetical protein
MIYFSTVISSNYTVLNGRVTRGGGGGGELERNLKDGVGLIVVISLHLPEETEENHTKPQLR